MNAVAQIHAVGSLPALVRRAADQLASATTAAEVLEAKDVASVAYDAAKSAARVARAKQAHDDVIAAVYRAQADALVIEAQAKRRLADEYDAAQERGEVRGPSDRHSASRLEVEKAGVADLGLTHKDIHEARQIRDAEIADPGIVERTVTERLMAGHEPTKAALRGAISALASQGIRPPAPSRQNPAYTHDPHFEAMAAIAGACTLIAEKIATLGPHFILKGFLDEAMRSRNVNTFRSGRDALQQLMDAADAQ